MVDFGCSPALEIVQRMVNCLRHRGPDAQGVRALGAATLGHARLSVIDLSEAGSQPMSTVDRRFTIVYNGEVYNFPELRQELQSLGACFFSRSDTEVVLQAFVHWGLDGFRRLNGIFACAIWDSHDERLWLVRDRFGVKPLHYHLQPEGGIIFGSEIKAVLAAANDTHAVDWHALHEFLYFGAGGLGARTLLAEVRKLEAGHYLELDRSGTKTEPYWHLDPTAGLAGQGGSAIGQVRELLAAAVQRQLVSDVPIGVFLSGGIDSSAVTAFASCFYGPGLRTFSVGFDFAGDNNELPKAAKVAQHFGTEHRELFIRGADLPEVIEALVVAHDAPFADAANIPLYLLCRELSGSVKVVLQGDGGDELFGGYRRYGLLRHARLLGILAQMGGALATHLPGSIIRRARVLRMVDIWREPDEQVRMALLMAQDGRHPSPTRLLGAPWREALLKLDPFERYRSIGGALAHVEPVQRMLLTDLQILLPDIFLEKVDRSTMAHGVESRVPFLDYELADYAIGLPAALKMPRGEAKGLLKRALRGVVPDFVLDAPKMGFAVPYGQWLRGPLAAFARDRICGGRARQLGFIDELAAGQALDDHAAGRADHGYLLWKHLNLAIWIERCGVQPVL